MFGYLGMVTLDKATSEILLTGISGGLYQICSIIKKWLEMESFLSGYLKQSLLLPHSCIRKEEITNSAFCFISFGLEKKSTL